MHVSLFPSPRKGKAYRATFTRKKDGSVIHTDFGSADYENYTQHHDDIRKKKFLTRFRSMIERYKDNPQAPTTLSRYILWNKPTIDESLLDYKRKFNFL